MRTTRRAGGAKRRPLAPVEARDGGGRRRVLLALVAAAAALLVFLPTLRSEFVDWDDTGVLTENESYRGLGAEQVRWMFTTNHYGHYQPVTWLTYGMDYVLWGMNPTGYHLTNDLFHAANTLLVFFLARALLRRALRREDGAGEAASARGAPSVAGMAGVDLAALLAALLFGVHPLRVESVAWATERRDLVSAFFLLLTLLAYLRAAAAPAGRRYAGRLAATLALYAVSMLSKVGGAPLPAVLLVLDWYPLRRFDAPPRRRLLVILEKLPFLAIALGFAVATIAQQQGRWLVTLAEHGVLARTAQAFYGLVFYAWKTVLPIGLVPLYELHLPLDPFAPKFVAAAAIVVAAAAAVIVAARRGRPAPLAAALCYGAMIGPLLGFFQNGPQIVADRYSYLSCLGWTILAAGGAHALATRGSAGAGATRRRVVVAACAAAVVALAALTWRQCGVWRNTTALWERIAAAEPDGSNASNYRGYTLLSDGHPDEAVPYLDRAIERNPRNLEAYYNLWRALHEAGRDDDLKSAYRDALDSPLGVIRADALFMLGNDALLAGRNEEAIDDYLRALVQREDHAPTHDNLARALARLHRNDEAIAHYRRAVQLDPTLVTAHYGLARTLRRVGRYDEAIEQAKETLRLDPRHPYAGQLIEEVERERGNEGVRE